MSIKIYTDKDADLKYIRDKQCAVIGFGSQGHAHALNLKDSNVNVIIGLYTKSKSVAVAKKMGFTVQTVSQAVTHSDIIFIALPDMSIKKVYEEEILPHLDDSKTLIFAHGFSVLYDMVDLPENIDVILVAPKSPGHMLRRNFENGSGVPALIAVYQDMSGLAKKKALAWAKGIGSTRVAVFETTFQEETETDLFGEQAVLCGGISALIQLGFETLIEANYKPEIAYFEVLHELKLITDMINESGISGMRFSVSETAKYGDLTVGPKVIDASVKKRMKSVLKDIQSGKFAKNWIKESETGRTQYKKLLEEGSKHPVEKIGQQIRSKMGWIKNTNISGVQANY